MVSKNHSSYSFIFFDLQVISSINFIVIGIFFFFSNDSGVTLKRRFHWRILSFIAIFAFINYFAMIGIEVSV